VTSPTSPTPCGRASPPPARTMFEAMLPLFRWLFDTEQTYLLPRRPAGRPGGGAGRATRPGRESGRVWLASGDPIGCRRGRCWLHGYACCLLCSASTSVDVGQPRSLITQGGATDPGRKTCGPASSASASAGRSPGSRSCRTPGVGWAAWLSRTGGSSREVARIFDGPSIRPGASQDHSRPGEH
jgi:hypothetical protein